MHSLCKLSMFNVHKEFKVSFFHSVATCMNNYKGQRSPGFLNLLLSTKCVCECVAIHVKSNSNNQSKQSYCFLVSFYIDGHGLSNEERHELLPKESKVIL